MLKVSRPFILIAGIISLTSACNFREDKLDAEAPTVVTDADLHYSVVNERVIAPYCLSCHSNAGGNLGGVNLETFAALQAEIGSVKSEVIDNRTMPPSYANTISTNAYELLDAWIAAGAPQ